MVLAAALSNEICQQRFTIGDELPGSGLTLSRLAAALAWNCWICTWRSAATTLARVSAMAVAC